MVVTGERRSRREPLDQVGIGDEGPAEGDRVGEAFIERRLCPARIDSPS